MIAVTIPITRHHTSILHVEITRVGVCTKILHTNPRRVRTSIMQVEAPVIVGIIGRQVSALLQSIACIERAVEVVVNRWEVTREAVSGVVDVLRVA